MKNKEDLISVVTAAYNHAPFIEQYINSLINQTYKNIELIIIDDGSQDDTYKQLLKFKKRCEERFVRVVMETQENQGLICVGNKLHSLVKGKFIYEISSDDVIAQSNAIEILHDFLVSHPDYGCVAGDMIYVDRNLKPIKFNKKNDIYSSSYIKNISKILKSKGVSRWDIKNIDLKYSDLWNCNPIPNGKMTRIEALKGFKFDVNCCGIEDLSEHFYIAKKYKEKVLDTVLCLYRCHKTNMSFSDLRRHNINAYGARLFECHLLETIFKDFDLSDSEKELNYLCINHEWDISKKSKYFDEKYYIQKNPDVKKECFIPLIHYLVYGRFEGKSPCSNKENDSFFLYMQSKCNTLVKMNLLRNRIYFYLFCKMKDDFTNYENNKTLFFKLKLKIFNYIQKKVNKKIGLSGERGII